MLTKDDILNSEELEFMNPLIKMFDTKGQLERWQNAKITDASTEDKIFKQHRFHLLIIKKLHDAGVNIICGTDAGIGITVPGASIHAELQFYSEAGLTNFEVLKTATINPSKTHKVMQNIGTIEEGKIANLILLRNDPLEDLAALRSPEMVFIKGRKLDQAMLQNFETKSRNRRNFLSTSFNYFENLILRD